MTSDFSCEDDRSTNLRQGLAWVRATTSYLLSSNVLWTSLDFKIFLKFYTYLYCPFNYTFNNFQDIRVSKGCKVSDFVIFRISKLRGLQRLQSFRLCHSQDIKVARVAKVAKFQTLSFSGYQGCEGCKGCKFSDFAIFRISRLRGFHRLQSFRLCHSQDIKVARVAKVAKFQILSFSGYQGCKVSDFVILRTSRLRGL